MNEYPAIVGWASDLPEARQVRDALLESLDGDVRGNLHDTASEVADGVAALYREVALRQADASWWLTRRDWTRRTDAPMGKAVAHSFTPADKERLAALRRRA